jgi:large subunit ribosomal protein L25
MSDVFEFLAETRTESGSGAARRLRRQHKIPAVLYGGDQDPVNLTLDHNDVLKHLDHEAVYSHILDLKVDGKAEKAILKDVQKHPAKPKIFHLDFMRVTANEKIRVHVPLHFLNEETSVGAKKGGVTTHSLVDVEIACLPGALPEYIEVDLVNLDVGESIHLTDIKLPEGVEIITLLQEGEHDLSVVSIAAANGVAYDEEEAESEAVSDV